MEQRTYVFDTGVHVVGGDTNVAFNLGERCSRRSGFFIRSFVAFESDQVNEGHN